MKKIATVTIGKTSGKLTIAESKLFNYVDSDFRNWDTDSADEKRDSCALDVLEMTEDMTFARMFRDPERQWITQSQVLEFVGIHQGELRRNGYATFFLFKSSGEFFVAYVDVSSGGLRVRVNRFEHGNVWNAERRHRLVVPQPETEKLDTSDPESLGASDPLSLGSPNNLTKADMISALTDEQMIGHLKMMGYKVSKEY